MARTSGRRRNADQVRREWGTVLDVRRSFTSRRLAADAALGAESVLLKSGSIFEGAGTVELNDQVVAYTEWDSTTGALALAEPLTAAAVEGDQVYVYLPRRQTRATDLEADVEIDGWDGEPLPALLAPGLDRELPIGPREPGEGEEVLVEYDEHEDEWFVTRSRGMAEAAGEKWAKDSYSLTDDDIDTGSFALALSHEDLVEHEFQMSRNGLIQDAGFDVALDSGVVTVTLEGHEQAEAAYEFHYAYRREVRRPDVLLVEFEATGWKYLVVGAADAVDRSAPGFNDSGWATGQGAFGDYWLGNNGALDLGHPMWNTEWTAGSGSQLWLRRTVTGGRPTRVELRIPNPCEIYWDGVLIADLANGEATSVEVDTNGVSGVLAIVTVDKGGWTYFDAQVWGRP